MRGARTLGLVLMMGLGCSSEGETSEGEPAETTQELRDTTGSVFDWVCDADGCWVTQVEGSPALPSCAEGLTPAFLATAGRFFMVRGTCILADGTDEAVDERIVACDDDSQCPSMPSVSDYECRANLCQSADHLTHPPAEVPSFGEIFRLCRAQSAWFSALESGLFDKIDIACPDGREAPCQEVPADCAQP